MNNTPHDILSNLTNATAYLASSAGIAAVVTLDKKIFKLEADGAVEPSDLDGLTAFMMTAISDTGYVALDIGKEDYPFSKTAEVLRFRFTAFTLLPLFKKVVEKGAPPIERLAAHARLQSLLGNEAVFLSLVDAIIDDKETVEEDTRHDLEGIPMTGRFKTLMETLMERAAGIA
jgi:hypothetical protein